jgi:hypothetical protein
VCVCVCVCMCVCYDRWCVCTLAAQAAAATRTVSSGGSSAPARPAAVDNGELYAFEKIDTALAMKHARFVASALQYDDIETAFKELKLVRTDVVMRIRFNVVVLQVAKLLSPLPALNLENVAIPKK